MADHVHDPASHHGHDDYTNMLTSDGVTPEERDLALVFHDRMPWSSPFEVLLHARFLLKAGLTITAPSVWDGGLSPGGYVCGVCGQPTESEPCREHQPLNEKPLALALAELHNAVGDPTPPDRLTNALAETRRLLREWGVDHG